MANSSLNDDGSQLQTTFPGMDDVSLYTSQERSRRVAHILSGFRETFLTESAFWLMWNKLTEADRSFLVSYWKVRGDWEAFLRLCRHFRVRVA